ENAKVAIRNVRRDALSTLKELLKEKQITEDDDRRAHDDIQKLTDRYVAQVDALLKEKEAEIMEFYAGRMVAPAARPDERQARPRHVAGIMDGTGRWPRRPPVT